MGILGYEDCLAVERYIKPQRASSIAYIVVDS